MGRMGWLAAALAMWPALALAGPVEDELAALKSRLAALEARLAGVGAKADATHAALSRELAQPVLLLVGEGPCPAGFERIPVEVMINTGPTTRKISAIIERAGLGDAEQPGVGARVFRYMDFCFRPAGSVTP